VAVTRLETLLGNAVDFHLRAPQRELQQTFGAGPADSQIYSASGSPSHVRDGPGEIRANIVSIYAHDLIARQEAGLLGWRAVHRPQDLDRRILRHDLDAHTGVGAHGAQADLFEFLAVEVGGMRIERGHHATNGFFHERVVIDLVDVFALDALVHLREL